MSKIFLTIASLMLVALPLKAASADFVDTDSPEAYIPSVELHGGVGVSTVFQNYRSEIDGCSDFFLTPGCQGIVGATVELPVRNFFSVGTGLDFAFSRYTWSMTVVDASKGTLTSIYSRNNYTSIDIPVYMSFKFNLGTRVRWVNELGFYLSQGIGGTSKYKAYVSSTNSLGQSQVTSNELERKYYKDSDPLINGVNRTDYGLHLATGMLFNGHWSVKAVMRSGFCDMARNHGVLDVRLRNFSASLRLGYCF